MYDEFIVASVACRLCSAETHANAEGIIQGLVDTDLSNIGYLQSQALGQHLQNHRFSHMYSSDLKRASEVRAFTFVSLNRKAEAVANVSSALLEVRHRRKRSRTGSSSSFLSVVEFTFLLHQLFIGSPFMFVGSIVWLSMIRGTHL